MRDLVAVIKLAFIPQSAVTLGTLHFIDRTDNYSAALTGPSVTAALQLLGEPCPNAGPGGRAGAPQAPSSSGNLGIPMVWPPVTQHPVPS